MAYISNCPYDNRPSFVKYLFCARHRSKPLAFSFLPNVSHSDYMNYVLNT